MSKTDRPLLGMALMIAATVLFASQDGISRHLATTYNTIMIVMIRYWMFTSVAVAWSATRSGGVAGIAKSRRPGLQMLRGSILVIEIFIAIQSFVLLGFVQAMAIFGIYPLIVAALSGPILNEPVGWRRWCAICVGFLGLLVILRPGIGEFNSASLLALASAVLFALYQLLTRLAAEVDQRSTSFLWTGIMGCIIASLIGPFFWQPMAPSDWGWMVLLAALAIAGHACLIGALDAANAASIQPLTYLHLVFAALVGVVIFDDVVDQWTLVGSAIVIAAGIFTLLRSGR